MTDCVVVYSARARRELRTIERYIAKKASPRKAAVYVARIIERCDRIAIAPDQGELQEHLRPGLRKTGMEGRVTILFVLVGSRVTILSISYGGRQFEADFHPPV